MRILPVSSGSNTLITITLKTPKKSGNYNTVWKIGFKSGNSKKFKAFGDDIPFNF